MTRPVCKTPNIPWEDRPAGCADVIWRSAKNPIITRDHVPGVNSIFNSAVVPFNGKFAGVFRCDDRTRRQLLHAGFSDDGIRWNIDPTPIRFQGEVAEQSPFELGYDPRVCLIDDRYIVTWCNGLSGAPTIGMAWTKDFKTYVQMENSFLPANRNGVMFPRKINGNYIMLSRPSDMGHTPFGNIYTSQSPDLTYWGKHRLVMKAGACGWESTKIGAGPIPIEIDDGWLMIYHGVLTSCNGYVYSMGAAILDRDQPWKVKHRCKPYLLSPQTIYECVGDVPNVAFPCAALYDEPTGRIAIYYGGADTVVCLAFTQMQPLIDFIQRNAH
ncbi:MAG: glycoside hydrolase family 130 protein [Phycisphaerales bacterium]